MKSEVQQSRAESTNVGEVGQVEDLAIDDLEDNEAPFNWVCVTSTTCKCTSTSCAGWQF